MNHKNILSGLLLAGLGLGGAAQAATYTNTVVAGTPFGVTLDTGSPAWETPSQTLGSADTGPVSGSTSYWSAPAIVTETIPAQVGVAGAINVYSQTTQTFYDTVSQYQGFNIGYSASLTGPLSVPQTYLLTGQVQNLIGSNLLNGGNGSVGFNMGLSLQFVEPYVANSGNAKLSFKFGAAPGQWTYAFEETFALNPGSIYLTNGNSINLANTTYFEAEYSIDGNPGVTFGIIPGLSLSMYGNVNTYQTTFNHAEPHQVLIASAPIPALSVPEAETYAMMLAGLGLVGFMVSRRRSI